MYPARAGAYALLHAAKAQSGPAHASLPPGGAPLWLGGSGAQKLQGFGFSSVIKQAPKSQTLSPRVSAEKPNLAQEWLKLAQVAQGVA